MHDLLTDERFTWRGNCELGAARPDGPAGAHLPRRGPALLIARDLVDELRAARWFGGKSRAIRATRVVDRALLGRRRRRCRWSRCSYAHGPPETYVLAERLDDPSVGARAAAISFAGAHAADRSAAARWRSGRRTCSHDDRRASDSSRSRLLRGEQSNTSIRFGDALILKLFRRLQFGPNPDVEIGWFLTEHSHFRGTPAVVGSTRVCQPGRRRRASLALLQRVRAAIAATRGRRRCARLAAVLDGADVAESVAAMARLGQTTAELHVALASGSGDFAPEPIAAGDVDAWRQAHRRRSPGVPSTALARRAHRRSTRDCYAPRRRHRRRWQGALKTRHHGDYHLGQVLERDDGSFVIIDFEGEPSQAARRSGARSARRCATWRACCGRSTTRATRRCALGRRRPTRARSDAPKPGTRRARGVSRRLPRTVGRALTRACSPTTSTPPLAALELEKAAYEVLYELNNRPDWLPIPLAALQR